jgi:hypothetical protein
MNYILANDFIIQLICIVFLLFNLDIINLSNDSFNMNNVHNEIHNKIINMNNNPFNMTNKVHEITIDASKAISG